jgi:hypothetical protein
MGNGNMKNSIDSQITVFLSASVSALFGQV